MTEKETNHFARIDIPGEDIFSRCIHCGLCLAVCPTYALTGLERSSPRGRIRLIRSVAENLLDMSRVFVDEMIFCLDCQACQTVCPPGVRFGQLVEASRAQIAEAGKDPHSTIKRLFFRRIFPSPKRLKLLARLLRWYQRWPRKLLYKTGLIQLLPAALRKLEPLAPQVSSQFSDEILAATMKPAGTSRYRVGFLTGCLMNVMFADINKDTVEVLLENGCEVVIPPDQACCGSLAAHNGDFEIARKLARQNIDAFLREELDALVINSAGCSAFMKEYGELLAGDPNYREKAKQLSLIVRDIHEFLVEIGLKPPTHPLPYTVTYHDACHLAHTQQITREPRQILRSIPGLRFVELPESTWCCGSAGIYNIVRHDDSMKILERKISNIVATGADLVATANPGCAVQISYGLKQKNLSTKVINPITLLNMAYKANQTKNKLNKEVKL